MYTHSYRRAYIRTHVTTYERKENRKTICPRHHPMRGGGRGAAKKKKKNKKKKNKNKKEKSNFGENLEYTEFSRI